MPDLKSKCLQCNGVNIHYAEGPDNGPPLILLHGISVRWQSFLPVIPFVINQWHVYAVDMRGHGESEHTSKGYGIEDYASDINEFIRLLVKQKPVIFGHSLGGMVALKVISGTSASALIIGDSPLFNTSIMKRVPKVPSMKQLAGKEYSVIELTKMLSEIFSGFDPAFYRYWAQSRRKLDPQALNAFEKWFPHYDCTEDLSKVTCPLLLLQSDWVTDEDVMKVQKTVNDVTVVKFDNLSHELHNENRGFKAVVSVIQFLESLEI